MSTKQIDAYRQVEKATLSGRELEASVLTKAAMLITEVQNRWEDADRDQRLDAALKYNQRLWTFFQAEVSQAENPLPAHIKENILSLSMFVDRRIFDVMAFPAREKLDILVTINRNIAAGLLGNPG